MPSEMDHDYLLAQRQKLLVLLLGSNIGNREKYLSDAIEALTKAFGEPYRVSGIHETEPWGMTDQDEFMNQAVVFETNQKPSVVLDTVLHIEQLLGRKREIKWGPRVIDIDIIFYGDLIYQSDVLEIPHPYMQERLFVLNPITEVLPDFNHPLLEKTVTELRDALAIKEGQNGE